MGIEVIHAPVGHRHPLKYNQEQPAEVEQSKHWPTSIAVRVYHGKD